MSYILLPKRFRAVTATLGREFKELAEALITENTIPPCDPFLKSIGCGLYLHQYSCIPSVLSDRLDLTDSQLVLMQAMGMAVRTDFRNCASWEFSSSLRESFKLNQNPAIGSDLETDLQTLDTYLRKGHSYRSLCQKVTDPVLQGIFIFLYGLHDQEVALSLTKNAPLQQLIVKSLGAGGLGWCDRYDQELVSLGDRLLRAWQGVGLE